MDGLELTTEKTNKYAKAEDSALHILQDVLDGKRDMGNVEKAAIQTLNIVSKNRQSLTHRAAIFWSIVSDIASPEQKKQYVKVTCPTIQKALT